MKYWAIASIGWGRGSSPSEAVEEYEKAQRRNFPRITDEELAESWGFVWEVPEEVTGFQHGVEGLYFTSEVWESGQLADHIGKRVENVGNVPEAFRVKEEA